MGKVKSIASSAVQRVAPSAFIFHFSFTTSPFSHHQLPLFSPLVGSPRSTVHGCNGPRVLFLFLLLSFSFSLARSMHRRFLQRLDGKLGYVEARSDIRKPPYPKETN